MITDFLIISCTGKKNKIGLRVNNNFFIHSFQSQNNDELASTIFNFTVQHKAKIDNKFSILINYGPGSFSTLRASLAVAKGIKITNNAKLFGYKNSDLSQFNRENIEKLIDKNLIEKKLIKPLYSS